ncbi:transposase [Halococcus sp. PRR34]|uniref:RNA-guided endonuclease InsQ/TnpB family protein n=1 Tax=Halococcus sp. PRR34 TaxID=3020830 RepID=UPI002360A3C7|nr:transposase [Halococcus sp. PRR34]
MDVRRTAVVKLAVSDEQRRALHATAEQYLHCANRTAAFCWADTDYHECRTHKRNVRDALYDGLRDETELQAQLVQAAIKRGVEAVKGCVERWKKGQSVSRPVFTSETMDYDRRCATFRRRELSLSTVEGRIVCPFVLPSDSPTPYERYVLGEEYEFRQSTVRYDKTTDEFYAHITTRRYDNANERGSTDTEHRSVLGIDLGVNLLAVASTGTFWQGDDYDHWVREFEKRRTKMQQQATQAGHHAMKRLGRRERAWRKQYLHTLANEIVTEAVENNCSTVVFEELDGIRERLPQADWHHIWAFRRLYEYVAYKAPERGVLVETVDPDHTSQRCSKCGFTHENNRDGGSFACLSCGYELHADYNAAKNIGLRYARQEYHRLRSSQMSSGGDAPVDVRLNRGTMTDDGPRLIAGD